MLAAETLRHAAGATPADASEAADAILETLIATGRLRRAGDIVAVAGHRPAAPDPARAAAMERLVAALDVAAPPSLRDAAVATSCPPDAVRELERDGRIVVVDDDLAWARPTWERLRDLAVGLARSGPLTPAALRDASGTSRKYVMALLEDLARRGILTRTADGHVPGPRS
jgi:selenocysteine-specific elongation factor